MELNIEIERIKILRPGRFADHYIADILFPNKFNGKEVPCITTDLNETWKYVVRLFINRKLPIWINYNICNELEILNAGVGTNNTSIEGGEITMEDNSPALALCKAAAIEQLYYNIEKALEPKIKED